MASKNNKRNATQNALYISTVKRNLEELESVFPINSAEGKLVL
jgi:hypothetical protein